MLPIKKHLNDLEKLQAFKAPLTRLWENFICSYSVLDISDDSNCEFFFIGEPIDDSFAGDENLIDVEIEETVKHLASLLSRKEQLIKKEVEEWYTESQIKV